MKFSKLFLCFFAFVFLSACSSVALTPTATNTVTVPTSTPQPTATFTPTETATPEATATQEIPNYGVCTIPEFMKCNVPVADFTNGNWEAFGAAQAKPFTADQLDKRPWGD